MRNPVSELLLAAFAVTAVACSGGGSSGAGKDGTGGRSSEGRPDGGSDDDGGRTSTGSGGLAGGSPSAGGAAGTGANRGSGGAVGTGAGRGSGGVESDAMAPPGQCEGFGRFGAPGTSFTLPGGAGIYYPDVQKSFPNVDWQRIDRLYVPKGKYKEFNLGNLPVRDAAHPLVITNQGGQVQVGPNPGANYIWSMDGGSHWILTGRYDEDSKTGDAAFPGHRCGAYGGSRGTYGFLSDDAFDLTAPFLHMGIMVSAATDFEIEFAEVTRSGFAGIRLLNSRKADEPAFDMANVKIHDNYIHDTDGEGTYFGWTGAPPANLLPGLEIYNNRIVRTGNEALQIQDLGDGTKVYDNVIAFAALHWRDNGLGKYQDNNSQIQTRSGTIAVHDNVFLGGAGTLLSFWSQPETGDGARHVTFDHNVFFGTKSLAAYLGGDAQAGSDFHFMRNVFGGIDFTYDKLDKTAKAPGAVFQIGGYAAPIEFADNRWDGPSLLVSGLASGNGTSGSVTGTGNAKEAVAAIAFEASGYPSGKPVQNLEMWAVKATVDPASPAITYAVGDLVMFDAVMYECTAENSGAEPPSHPAAWKRLPLPADDFRIKSDSPYAKVGIKAGR